MHDRSDVVCIFPCVLFCCTMPPDKLHRRCCAYNLRPNVSFLQCSFWKSDTDRSRRYNDFSSEDRLDWQMKLCCTQVLPLPGLNVYVQILPLPEISSAILIAASLPHFAARHIKDHPCMDPFSIPWSPPTREESEELVAAFRWSWPSKSVQYFKAM